ncbi:MAG TPA: FAD-dependent oxidoreductase [Tepidisphaeraceae bacterium]|nr:FAD-dependent oxidoreductase [Tepidisphaeraceae bacterium]
MDLRTGNPLWPELSAPLIDPPAVAGDVSCDALVLGAGVTGAFSALLLAEAGLNVVVIDRRGIGQGSTAASTALIQYEIDTPLVKLAKAVGAESAQMAYRATRRALDDMIEIARNHHVSCDLHWCGSLFLACTDDDPEWFEREARARRELGIEVENLCRGAVMDRFDIDRPGALLSSAAIRLNPFMLTHGLLRAAERQGARIYRADVKTVMPLDRVYEAQTLAGPILRASDLIIATGYETPEQFSSVRKYCKLKSTYALATAPLRDGPAWPGDVLLWEAGSPYFYARQAPDNRLVIGGEDEPFSNAEARDALIESKSRVLMDKFRKLRPGVDAVPTHVWAGTFGESDDGMPLIGRLPQYPGCHFALGYGGNGITFGLLAAQMTRDSILARPNPLANVFRFNR